MRLVWAAEARGKPIPQARYERNHKTGTVYYPPESMAYRAGLVAAFAARLGPACPFKGPLMLSLRVLVDRPHKVKTRLVDKLVAKRGRTVKTKVRETVATLPELTEAGARPFPDSRGILDLSNIAKQVEDALESAGVIDNDARIVAYLMPFDKQWTEAPGRVLVSSTAVPAARVLVELHDAAKAT